MVYTVHHSSESQQFLSICCVNELIAISFLSVGAQAHEQQVQFLMHQLAESESLSGGERDTEQVEVLEAKVKLLEKDLYYYKKTSRELKRKIQEFQQRGDEQDVAARQMVKERDTTERSKSTASSGSHKPPDPTAGAHPSSQIVGADSQPPSSAVSLSPLLTSQPPGGGRAPAGVVRKSKKQLRQLR